MRYLFDLGRRLTIVCELKNTIKNKEDATQIADE
jgi:hypothetical protein